MDVAEWLRSLGLAQYERAFRDNAVDADILPRLAKTSLPGEVKPEITESMIELNSSVHESASRLIDELHVLRKAVVDEAGLTAVDTRSK